MRLLAKILLWGLVLFAIFVGIGYVLMFLDWLIDVAQSQ